MANNIRYDERERAMRGYESFDLSLDNPYDRAAIIHGIRHNLQFAQSDRITSLCTGEDAQSNSDFCRARNARLIMSGIMPSSDEIGAFDTGDTASGRTVKRPYCIWHPEFATEDFYRNLVQKYPDLRYQVGRACAAAGYHALYQELDLLPDVSMAEEARESNAEDSRAIYDAIMAAKARYQVMDDYALHVKLDATPINTLPAHLSGTRSAASSITCVGVPVSRKSINTEP